MAEATAEMGLTKPKRVMTPEHKAKMLAGLAAARAAKAAKADAPVPVAAPASDALSTILGEIRGIGTRLSELETRVNQGVPRMVKTKPSPRSLRPRAFAEIEVTETKDGPMAVQVQHRLTTAKGTPLSPGVLRHTGSPAFQIGQRVQLNPNVQPENSFMVREVRQPKTDGRGYVTVREVITDKDGNPIPRFWKDIITEARITVPEFDGGGEVRQTLYLSDKTGEWKYRVYFPGLSHSTSGEGYWEHELLAA